MHCKQQESMNSAVSYSTAIVSYRHPLLSPDVRFDYLHTQRYLTLSLSASSVRSCRVDDLDSRTYVEHEMYDLGAVQSKLLHVYSRHSRQHLHVGVLEFLLHNARSASAVLLSRPSVCQSVCLSVTFLYHGRM